MGPGWLVEAEGLIKVYPDGTRAVDGVTLRAGEGVTVLMGPNGSGKTTTMAMVAGALRPTSGRVLVCGHDVWGRGYREARECIGYAMQETPYREKLRVIDNLVWYGMLRGMSPREAASRARRVLEELGLGSGVLGKRVQALSGGMRKRLSIAMALLGDPRVLVLDEPTSGLDPAARESLWADLKRLSRGRAVVASTHIPEEAERHADQVIVMHRGRVVAAGPPGELVRRYAPQATVTVTLASGEPVEEAGGAVLSYWDPRARVARYAAEDPDTALPRLVEALLGRGARVRSVEVSKPGLAEVYLAVTGARLEGVG